MPNPHVQITRKSLPLQAYELAVMWCLHAGGGMVPISVMGAPGGAPAAGSPGMSGGMMPSIPGGPPSSLVNNSGSLGIPHGGSPGGEAPGDAEQIQRQVRAVVPVLAEKDVLLPDEEEELAWSVHVGTAQPRQSSIGDTIRHMTSAFCPTVVCPDMPGTMMQVQQILQSPQQSLIDFLLHFNPDVRNLVNTKPRKLPHAPDLRDLHFHLRSLHMPVAVLTAGTAAAGLCRKAAEVAAVPTTLRQMSGARGPVSIWRVMPRS